jgi:DNA repair exonuclease SbcCD ATPase subunit
MLKQEEMQAARKDARELEQSLTHALEEYLRFDYSSHITATGGDLEQGGGKLQKLENNVADLIEKLHGQIERMESMGSTSNQSTTWKAQISRLRQFLQSSQADFKRTREAVTHRQESAALLQAARERTDYTEEDAHQRLYEKEREGIHSSMKMMDDSIGKALAVQDAIKSQRDRIRRATSRLANMAESIPGINQLIAAASRKKVRDNLIVATAIAFFICLTLWWMLAG